MTKRTKMNKNMKGALGESLGAAWLILQGWQVFQQVGVTTVDMMAYKPETKERLTVEVKTATRRVAAAGDVRFYWQLREGQFEHCDMLIVVTDDGRVFDATLIESPVRAVELGEPMMVRPKVERLASSILDEHGNKR